MTELPGQLIHIQRAVHSLQLVQNLLLAQKLLSVQDSFLLPLRLAVHPSGSVGVVLAGLRFCRSAGYNSTCLASCAGLAGNYLNPGAGSCSCCNPVSCPCLSHCPSIRPPPPGPGCSFSARSSFRCLACRGTRTGQGAGLCPGARSPSGAGCCLVTGFFTGTCFLNVAGITVLPRW